MSAIDALVTPIFTPEMGKRMSKARMFLDLNQAQLGERLGITQQMVAAIETGRCAVPRKPFTMAKFREVFTDTTYYVLKGSDAERVEQSPITLGYRERRNARPGNGSFRVVGTQLVSRAKPLLGAAQLEARKKKAMRGEP